MCQNTNFSKNGVKHYHFSKNLHQLTTCEIGVREGLGSQVIMLGIKSRIGNIPYEHIGIDPYNDLEYKHFDDEVEDPKWKDDDKWQKKFLLIQIQ